MTVESLAPNPLTLAAVESLNQTPKIQNAAPQFALANDSNAVVGLSLLFESKIVVLGLNPIEVEWQRVTEFEFPDDEGDIEAQEKAQDEMHTTTDETYEWFLNMYGPQNVAVLDASEYG